MEAAKLATLTDLLAHPEERVELIDGEIVRRPMARAEHGLVQSNIVGELQPLRRPDGFGGCGGSPPRSASSTRSTSARATTWPGGDANASRSARAVSWS